MKDSLRTFDEARVAENCLSPAQYIMNYVLDLHQVPE